MVALQSIKSRLRSLKSKLFRQRKIITPQAAAPVQSPVNDAASREQSPPPSATACPPDTALNEDAELSRHLGIAAAAVKHTQTSRDTHQDSTTNKLAKASGEVLETITSESHAMQLVRDGVNTLVDSLPALAKALAEIAKVHPFIGVAVEAFQVVVELNSKRRSNDEKIGVLFLQMQDMMEALLQLRFIKDTESVDQDTGLTVKARMQELCKLTADDISKCGNVCDTYSKKRLVVKVIQSSSWEDALKKYIDIFAQRRDEFAFALSIHVAAGVEDTARKLNSLDIKIDILVKVLTSAVTPEYKEVAAIVQKKGGIAAVEANKEVLSELLAFESARSTTTTMPSAQQGSREYENTDDDVEVLKSELRQKPEDAIQYNFAVFLNKYELQQRELANEFRHELHIESDRILEAVTSGSWARIAHEEIREIWKEMRWSGHVKTQQFVLVVRDYYRQRDNYRQRMNEKAYAEGGDFTSHAGDNDQWAIDWIDIARLSSIGEAFDDDASGYITIAEVNQFTAACPEGWSLPRWLAYWAIGWQMTATYYQGRIIELLAKMSALEPFVHPTNMHGTQRYLRMVYRPVYTLASSCAEVYQSEALQARFRDYVSAEEEFLRRGLQTFRYKLEDTDTLSLITGAGRIEKYLFPLLYVLLRRDFEILRLARVRQLDPNELRDSAHSIRRVLQAVQLRHDELEAIFKQRKLDPTQQFKVHANGVFYRWHDHANFWSLRHQRQEILPQCSYIDKDEDQNVNSADIINYLCPAACMPVNEEDVRHVPVHFVDCDACHNRIRGARLICLQCGARDTLDVCDERACVQRAVMRADLAAPHLPTHDFVKVRRVLNDDREIGTVLRTSAAGLWRARGLLDEAAWNQAARAPHTRRMMFDEGSPWVLSPEVEVEKVDVEIRTTPQGQPEPGSASASGPTPGPADKRAPACISCSKPVSYRRSWYCIDCPAKSDVFVCLSCDRQGGVTAGAHEAAHSLVLCTKEEVAPNLEDRFVALGRELAKVAWRVEMIAQAFQQA